MCLDTFSSIPSKDGPIVPKRQGGGRAKIMGRKKTKKQKKKENRGSTQQLERGERDGEGNVSKSFFVRAHLAPPPPQG